MRRKRDSWRWALALTAALLFGSAFGGCDAVSGIDDLAFERGPGTFCESFDDCADGNYCDYQDRVCRAQLPIGAECSSNEQCASDEARTGRCAHGFCCDGPCTGDCFACDLPGLEGSCQVLRDDTDPHDDCPDTTVCGADGRCRGWVMWTERYGDTRGDVATGVAFDTSDGELKLVVVGTFHDTINFGDVPRFGLGSTDIFVAKLKLTGEVVWSATFGGAGAETVAGVALDSKGDVLVAGDFEGDVTFGQRFTATDRDAFLLRLDKDGNVINARAIGGTGDQRAAAIAVDPLDRVIVAGSFVDSIEYSMSMSANGSALEDAFVVVFEPNDSIAWHRELGDIVEAQRGRAVAADSQGNVMVAVDGRGIVEGIGGTSDENVFLVRLAHDTGSTVWPLLLGGSGDQFASDVLVDSRDRVWITGSFNDGIQIPGGMELAAIDDLDGYYAAFNAAAEHVVSGAIGGSFDQVPLALAVDGDDEVSIVGRFQLDLRIGSEPELHGVGAHDIFVVKLTSEGVHQWARVFGGPLDDEALAIAADLESHADDLQAGRLAVVGSFQASIDLGGTALDAVGDSDLYAALLAP